MTGVHQTVDHWLREGRPQPMSPDVREHLDGCNSCRMALAEVDEVRGWFPDPGELLGADSVEAVRFRLLAEARARKSGTPTTEVSARVRRPWRWMAVAAAVLLVAGGGALALLSLVRQGTIEESALAVVTASPGAVVKVLEGPPHEVHRVVDGSATFSVRKLGAGRRFRVIVGEDLIVVRGTRFQVQARAGRLEEVRVSEGVVSLLLGDGRELSLAAGGTWRREPLVASRAVERERRAPDESVHGGSQTAPEPGRPEGAAIEIGRRAAAPAQASRPRFVRRSGAATAEAEIDPGVDRAFHDAWRIFRSGDSQAAAAAFDELLRRQDLGDRRADVLFWSARAHQQAGEAGAAHERLDDLVRSHPGAWHEAEARGALEAGGEDR